MRLYLPIALSILSLFILGCFGLGDRVQEKAGEKLSEKLVEKAIEHSNPGAQVSFDGGGDVDLSALPEFLRYPGARAMGSFSSTQADGSGMMFLLESSDAQDKVVGFYKKALSRWPSASEMNLDGTTMLVHQSEDEDQGAHVTVAPSDGKTAISVLYFTK